jgi:hypothetical protein
VEFTGRLNTTGPTWTFIPASARGWSEADIPFMELCQRDVEVKPKMSLGLRFFLATRLPFVTATLVPVVLGIAAAATQHRFNLGLAALTLLGAVTVHLGLNVASDVIDATSGADDFNVNSTMFSGGSRVIQYGLVSLRQMIAISAVAYAVAIAIGLYLASVAGWGLLWLGLASVLISYFYTAPPLRLVHRGLGELATALGFGPIMVLGAYYVQTGLRPLAPGALHPGGAAGDADPLRQRDPRPRRRRPRREVHPGGPAQPQGCAPGLRRCGDAGLPGAGRRRSRRPAALADPGGAAHHSPGSLRGLEQNYDDPYVLMGSLQNNVALHFSTGILLVAGTLRSLLLG